MNDFNTNGTGSGVPAQPGGTTVPPFGAQPVDAPSFVQSGPDVQQPVAAAAPGPYAPGPGAPNPSAPNPYAPGPYAPNPYAAGPYAPNPYAAPQAAPTTRAWSVLAIIGFVAGLIVLGISLFSGIVVMAIAPIALSVRALQDIKRNGKKGKGLAIAGIVLGGISAVLYLINIVLS